MFIPALFLLMAARPEGPAPSASPPTISARVAVRGAELAVTLALPSQSPEAKSKALVILPGSGPSTRSESNLLSPPFLRAGLAVLTFDKRGCGDSTGSWLTSSLEDMAADGRALLEWLKSRPEVDGASLGLVGVSQGGWVAPLVASGRSDVSFFVALTGGGMSPRVTERFDYERRLEDAGVVGPDLVAARKTVDAYFAYLAGEVPQTAVTNLLESGSDRGWPSDLGIGRVLPSEAQRPAWSWVATFDPEPSLRSLRLPVLAIIGGRDRDPAAEVTAWQKSLSANPEPRTEIRVVPGAGHVLTIGGNHMRGIFNTQAMEAMADWAARVVGRPGGGAGSADRRQE